MSDAACKAVICDDKAESTARDLADIPAILKNEKTDLRIKVAEYIIDRNNETVTEIIKMIGDA